MINDFVLVYLDDILVFSRSASEHLAHMRRVLERLRKEQWFAKRKKCSFAETEARYLGHVVGHGRCRVDPAKTEAVRSWPAPTCTKELQQFLGLANYYHEFIQGYAELASPMTDVLSTAGGKSFEWGEA